MQQSLALLLTLMHIQVHKEDFLDTSISLCGSRCARQVIENAPPCSATFDIQFIRFGCLERV